MGIVPIDAAGQPLRSAIIWADQRAVEEAETIGTRCGPENIYRRTGHRVSPAYLAAKILWVKQHQPDLYRQTKKFLCAKDFIAFKLTGRCATDYSDASGSNLFDLTQRAWSADLIDAIGLDAATLPEVHASTDVLGEVTREASEATGLKTGTPVVIGGGDGACATAGAGVIAPGDAYCNIGSSAWISLASAAPLFDPQQRTFTFHHLHPRLFTPMGTMQAAGGARDWLAATHRPRDRRRTGAGRARLRWRAVPAVSDRRAQPVVESAGARRVRRLDDESHAGHVGARGARRRGVQSALDPGRARITGRGSAGHPRDRRRRAKPGRGSKFWPMCSPGRFTCSICRSEASSWGAAVAGGIGVGVYADWDIAKARAEVKTVIDPIPANVALYADRLAVFADTYRALESVSMHNTGHGTLNRLWPIEGDEHVPIFGFGVSRRCPPGDGAGFCRRHHHQSDVDGEGRSPAGRRDRRAQPRFAPARSSINSRRRPWPGAKPKRAASWRCDPMSRSRSP